MVEASNKTKAQLPIKSAIATTAISAASDYDESQITKGLSEAQRAIKHERDSKSIIRYGSRNN